MAYDLVYNEKKQVIAVDIKIDETWHTVGKKELWDLKRICEITFDTILTQKE